MDKKLPLKPLFCLSPDEAVMPPLPSVASDFRQFQDVVKRVADPLQISLDEVKGSTSQAPGHFAIGDNLQVALPINEVLLDSAKTMWQTPSTIPLTCKPADKK